MYDKLHKLVKRTELFKELIITAYVQNVWVPPSYIKSRFSGI